MTGFYRVDHRLLRSNTTPYEYLQYAEIPHLSPVPFALAGEGKGACIVTIDRDFLAIVKAKLGTLWIPRQTQRITDGHSYDVDDFRVRVGRLMMADTARGIVVEVEYLPVDTMAAAEPVLRDFVESLDLPFEGRWVLGPSSSAAAGAGGGAHEKKKVGAAAAASAAAAGAGDEWTALDTGRLYFELMRVR